jgi:predicted AAA+ superfamily ATPase
VVPPEPEVPRHLASTLTLRASHATVLTGVRRSGKSTLQGQLMRQAGAAVYASFEDTRLYGFGPDDFPTVLELLSEVAPPGAAVFLDEIQEVADWPRLVRALLDRRRIVCVTGSNASLIGREIGTRLTGRHLSHEVFPFSYDEYLRYTGEPRGAVSFRAFLDDGGFPGHLATGHDAVLQTLLRDVVLRDVAARHGLRDTRHVMHLALYLLANTGQPLSHQALTRALAVPTVGQTSRYVQHLTDAYLIFAVPRHSTSIKQRVVAPPKYYAVDNGLRRANAAHAQPDVGHRLENAVALHLRRQTPALAFAGERGVWECDFVTADAAIQACTALTPANRQREVRGVIAGARLGGTRQALILTLDQADQLVEDGVRIDVVPTWRWMTDGGGRSGGGGASGSW